MIQITKSSATIALLAVTLTIGGCAGEPRDESPGETVEATPPLPPQPESSAAGLELSTSTPDRVAGRLERDGATVVFALQHDRARDVRHVLIERVSGEPLFESTLERGLDTSTLLGGRARTTAAYGTEPKREGDLAAFDELSNMPEAAAASALTGALEAAGVAPDLYRARPAHAIEAPGAIEPRVLVPWDVWYPQSFYPDNRWISIPATQSIYFYANFWTPTTVYIWGTGTAFATNIYTSQWEAWTGTNPYGHTVVSRWWYGAYMKISAPSTLCGVGQWSCPQPPTWVLVR